MAYKKPQIDNWNKLEETLEVISFNLSILWLGKSPEDESDQKTQSDQIRTWAQISGLQVECPLHYQPRADTTLIPTPLRANEGLPLRMEGWRDKTSLGSGNIPEQPH